MKGIFRSRSRSGGRQRSRSPPFSDGEIENARLDDNLRQILNMNLVSSENENLIPLDLKAENLNTNSEEYQDSDNGQNSSFDNMQEQNMTNFDNPHVKLAIQNPLGSILIRTLINNQCLGNKQKVQISDTDIIDMCKQFNNHNIQQKNEQKALFDQLSKNFSSLWKQGVQDKHFTHFKTNTSVQPPSYYSPKPTLPGDHQQLRNASIFFPINPSQRFTGGLKSPVNVVEWLSNMTNAQNHVRLSYSEFCDFLLRSCSSEIRDTIEEFLSSGMKMDDIYQSMLSAFESKISPYAAQTKLMNYRIPKNISFEKAQHQILKLASRASKMYTDGVQRESWVKVEAVNCLIRSVPKESRTFLFTKLVELSSELSAVPSFTDFTRSLRKYSDKIDQDIRTNGVHANYNGDISIYKNKDTIDETNSNLDAFNPTFRSRQPNSSRGNFFSKNTKNSYVRKAQSNFDEPKESQFFTREIRENSEGTSRNRYNQNQRQNFNKNKTEYQHKGDQHDRRGKFQNNFRNGDNNLRQRRIYCELCGKQNSHTSSSGCYAIFNNDGKVVKSPPVSQNCRQCEGAFGRKLYHSETLCPIRPKAFQLYAENKVRPVGIFKREFLSSQEKES